MGTTDSNSFRLHVLGAPDLRAPDGRRVTSVLSQPKRLGLLTYLALAAEPVTRASVVALFWPESDEARARNALSQAVFYLRRSLDERVVQSVEGDRLWAPPEHLWCDARDDASAAGTFLDGWNAEDSHELQEWLDRQRRRIAERAERGAARHAAASAMTPAAEAPGSAAAAPAATAGSAAAAATGSAATSSATVPPTAAGSATAPPAPPAAPAASAPFAPPASARHRPILPRATRLAAVAALAVLVGAALTLSLVGDRAQGGEAPATGTLAVLMPQVSASAGAPTIDADALHAEILAALPHVPGVRIVSARYAGSVQDFRRQLTALGVAAPEEPRWILEVSIRVAAREARGVGLLHRSPEDDLPGRAGFGVTWASAEAALLEAPEEVAREVAAMVARVLGGPRGPRSGAEGAAAQEEPEGAAAQEEPAGAAAQARPARPSGPPQPGGR